MKPQWNFQLMLSLMTSMPLIVLNPHSVTDRRRRPKILFCPIQSHALQGLHILRSPISRPRILRPRCPDLVLFLGFRVDFFSIYAWYTRLHFLESAWHNQKLFSEKTSLLQMNVDTSYLQCFFSSDVRDLVKSVFTLFTISNLQSILVNSLQ